MAPPQVDIVASPYGGYTITLNGIQIGCMQLSIQNDLIDCYFLRISYNSGVLITHVITRLEELNNNQYIMESYDENDVYF